MSKTGTVKTENTPVAPKGKKTAGMQDIPLPKITKGASMPELVRGMKDILPNESSWWETLYENAADIARGYGFGLIETPIVEHTSLFVRAVGKQTDIVEKELYRFVDQGGDDLVLRPEATASIVRAYSDHGMWNQPQPIKVWYWGQMFRHDRPQAGRYRQFHQCGFETLGDNKPVVDAEIIIMSWNYLNDLGLKVNVQINSLGTNESREAYREKLVAYYRGHRQELCDVCKARLSKNPLRLLDCKEEGCLAIRSEAPQIIDSLDDDSRNHFMRVLEYLDELEIPYVLNPHLVRGLDYYNRTVFEFVLEGNEEGSQNSLGGGGRYDGLSELLGGRPTPGCGVALGIERIALALKDAEIRPKARKRPQVFLAQLGEQAKRTALKLFETCRKEGLQVSQAFAKDSLKAQLEIANKLNVSVTIIIGQKEVLDGTAVVRDMESGVQEIVDKNKLVSEVRKKLQTMADRRDEKLERAAKSSKADSTNVRSAKDSDILLDGLEQEDGLHNDLLADFDKPLPGIDEEPKISLDEE